VDDLKTLENLMKFVESEISRIKDCYSDNREDKSYECLRRAKLLAINLTREIELARGWHLAEDTIREDFESIYLGGNRHTSRRNEHGDYVLPSISDALGGWHSACTSKR
jgi:hypothetical protein